MTASSAQSLSKGQNAPLSTTSVVLSVDVAAPADLSALLVTTSGTVRTDADFVFFNQPDGPGVHLAQDPGRLEIDLAGVPADVEQVRAVLTLEGDGAQFGPLMPPLAQVRDGAGTALFTYAVEGLSTESVLVALELYRRDDGWKVRAVGQGYAGGFADLITDHGVSVDDAPERVATPAPTAAPTPQAPPEVQLTKNKPVSLSKGQKVTLRKDGGTKLTLVRMGLGWDPVTKRGVFGSREAEIDLDASAMLMADATVVDIAFFNQLRSKDGSVVHQGDNRTGAGDGDDEVVVVDLTRVPAQVTTIVFIVTSYEGQTFTQVDNAFCRLVDHTNGTELARYTLGGGEDTTAMMMAKVYREGSDWKLEALGQAISARNPMQAMEQVSTSLR